VAWRDDGIPQNCKRIMEEGVAESVEPKDAESPRTADVPAAGRLLGVSSRPRIVATGRSILSLLIVIGLHAGLLVGLIQYRPQPPLPFQAPKPMMVSLVSPPVPQPQSAVAEPVSMPVEPDPKPLPPQPKPKPKKVVRPVKKPAPRPNAIQVPVQAEIAAPPKPAAPRAVQGPPIEAPPEPVLPKLSADYLKNPAPDYPLASRRLGEKGKVLLRVLVSAEGKAEQVEIDKSSGFARLDQAAKATVRNWLFVPAKLGDKSVRAWVIVPIVFTLRG
jgi:protein TonB